MPKLFLSFIMKHFCYSTYAYNVLHVRDRAWFVRLYGEMIFSVDLAHYGVSCIKDWVSVDCGTINILAASHGGGGEQN